MENKEFLKKLLFLELARRDFWSFCILHDRPFFEARPFLREIAKAMQEIHDRKIKSLSVSLPPRAGKSYITSLFCAWTLGKKPAGSVMRNTCTATLYVKFSYDVRAILKTPAFRETFPTVHLSDDKANLQGWNTNHSKQVGYFGSGVGGTIIGFGATEISITDDLYRGIEDAMSDTINERIVQWKESTHDSREETGCAKIDIGTRWSVNDIIGKNQQDGNYDRTIIVPALNDKDQSFCESVMSTEEYHEKRKRTAPEIWQAEYQQTPVDIKGRLFNELKFIEEEEFNKLIKEKTNADYPLGIQGAIAYVDVADQGADYTACLILANINEQLFAVDIVYNRTNTDQTIPQIASKLEKWNVSYCRVESNNMGAMFARQLQLQTRTKILQVHNATNKQTRIIMQSAYIQQAWTFVKKEEPETIQFIQSMLAYTKDGKNKHDDAPDCSAGLSIFAQSLFKIKI